MNVCGRCGEEIRYGQRGTVTGWLHREDVDHQPMHGRPTPPELVAHWDAQMDVPRERVSSEAAKHCPTYQDLWPLEVYTTREVDILKDPDSARRKRRLAEFRGVDLDQKVPLPEPEVRCHPVTIDEFPSGSGIAQIYNLITGVTRKTPAGKSSKSPKHPPMAAPGWELRRFTHARGPYIGSTGEVLSISDTIVMGARGPEVDGGYRIAVASWRDGSFDFAYTGIVKGGTVNTEPANSDALKAWIKDTP